MIRIDCDANWATLRNSAAVRNGGIMGAVRKPLGAPGLQVTMSLNDFPDKLIVPADYKEVVTECNQRQIFARYHQANSWAPSGFKWNQNGLPYCWAWSLTAAIMDVEAREGVFTDILAPISFGPAVDWRDSGNYLENAIEFAVKYGVCSIEYAPVETWEFRNPRNFKKGWQEDALQHRISEEDVWRMDDTCKTNMIQHCITTLQGGDPIYIAYYWWGHALELIGLNWSEDVPNSLEWVIRNSHGEDEPIILTGSRAVPDEAFGVLATEWGWGE